MDRDNKPSCNAAQHVLNIPELLETILLDLPPRDLLLCQRTSRSFRNTVQGSVRLRRILFLEPDWELQTWASHPHAIRDNCKSSSRVENSRPQNNWLLLRAFPGCYPTLSRVTVPEDQRHLRGERDNTMMQQLLFAQGARGSGSSGPEVGSEERSWDVSISFPACEKEQELVRAAAVQHPEASWRRMFLCQPPCKELYLVLGWRRDCRPAVAREAGITMGNLCDEAMKPVPRCEDREWHQSYVGRDHEWHFEGSVRRVTVVR